MKKKKKKLTAILNIMSHYKNYYILHHITTHIIPVVLRRLTALC